MADVYTGYWVNWEDGRIRGATLTVPTYQGLIFISFLALYVQFAGAHFWRVVCFWLHQTRSTAGARDGLFHQQQAILRNATTAPGALWELGCAAHAWAGKAKSPFRSSAALMLAAAAHTAVFAAAGLFSSQVTNSYSGLALVRPGACGFAPEVASLVNIRNTQDLGPDELRQANTEILLARVTLAKSAAYVRSCYKADDDANDANVTAAVCNQHVRPRLVGVGQTASANASCPFGDGAACAVAAARYDSGHIHSDAHLGINNPKSESLSMRKVTTCAPVAAEGRYTSAWRHNVPEARAGRSNSPNANANTNTTTSAKYYEFGKAVADGCDGTSVTTDTTTFCITRYEQDNLQAAYTVRANTAYYSNANASSFAPVADFKVPNADVTLASILSLAKYAGSSADPLFGAQTQPDKSKDLFTSTNDLNILGCTEQYQFCNVAKQRCTELTGIYHVRDAIDNGTLALTARQQAACRLMWKSAWAMGLQWAFKVLADEMLLAREYVFTTSSKMSSALPEDQWRREAHNLHSFSLAVFQRRVVEYASPENFEIRPGTNSLTQIQADADPDMQALCAAQKIRSTQHSSISILGTCVILVGGGFLILLDVVLVQQTWWSRAATPAAMAKRAEWENTAMIRLHQQTLEARGIGPWDTTNPEFPTLVTRRQMFSTRDLHRDLAGQEFVMPEQRRLRRAQDDGNKPESHDYYGFE